MAHVFGTLSGLKGVRRDLPCVCVKSVTEAMRELRKHQAVSMSGDNGCINIWREDGRRMYHAERARFRCVMDEMQSSAKKDIQAWLRENAPLVR